MKSKIFTIAIFIINIASMHIIQTMHKRQSKELSPFDKLQATQARYPKPLLVFFEENEKGITYRISGFQNDAQKFITFSNNHLVQENKPSQLNKKELFEHLIKPLIVYSHKRQTFSISGLTKDQQYTDYLKLSKINRSNQPNVFLGTVTRIKKAFMYKNLNFEPQTPEPYILDQATAERYWLSAEKALRKQRKAKKIVLHKDVTS